MRVYRVIFALIAAILALSIGTQAVVPGIQSGVSIGAVQRLVNKVLPPMLNIVKNTKFPDVAHEEKKQKGYLYSPTFKQLDIGSFVAQVSNGRFTVGIRDLHLELHAGWRVKIKKLVWISTHGNVDARFSASQILATFNFGTRDIGAGKFKPTVGVSSVSVDFTNTRIKISRNILAWFVNLLTSFLKNKIRSAVNTAVRDALQGGLSTLASRMTDAIPTSLALGSLGSINLGVTSPISTPGNNVLALAFDGQITSRAGHVGIADRHSVPFTPTGRMLDLFIDTFVLNSGSDAAFKSKTFSAVAHGNAPPAGLTIPMIGSSLGLPQLNAAGHGNKFLRVTAHPVEAFRINSATNALSAAAKVDLHIDINLGNGTYIEALVVRCESSGSVNVSFGNVAGTPILSPKLNSLGATFSTVRSSFGTVTFGKLNALLGQILNGVVVPAVNTFVLQPVPIPTTVGLTLANPAISFRQNHIYAGFDVDFNL